MKIIILSTEAQNFVPKEFKKKAEEKGHTAEIVNPNDCYISITDKPYVSYKGEVLTDIDLCIPRMSEEATEYKGAIFNQLLRDGVKCINSGDGMLLASNKLDCQIALNKNGIRTPKSIMLTDDSQLENAMSALDNKFPMIVKTIYGAHGIGVIKVDNKEGLRSIVQYMLKCGESFMLQEFIPHDVGYRMLMLNDTLISGVSRSVPEFDFRTNSHNGAEQTKYDPSEQEIELGKKCAKIIGLNFTAIDYVKMGEEVIILEVNGSPGFEALQKVVDFSIAEKILDMCLTETTAESDTQQNNDEIKNGENEVEAVSAEEETDNEKEINDEQIDNEIIGTVSDVVIKNFNDDKPIEARVDTGATHSSLNGQNIEVSDNIVKFTFGKYRYKFYLARTSSIKTSDNGTEERPVIKVDVVINGNEVKNVEFNINEREHMKYDVILGRSTLEAAGVLVNPAITKITDKEENKSEEE